MRFTLHTFRASETIDAVIRLKGRHSYAKEEMSILRRAFDELNGKVVPRPGMQYKIPLPMEAVDEFGNLVETGSQYAEMIARADAASASPGVAGDNESRPMIDSV